MNVFQKSNILSIQQQMIAENFAKDMCLDYDPSLNSLSIEDMDFTNYLADKGEDYELTEKEDDRLTEVRQKFP